MMQMYRQVMERSGPPHNEGISWAKFQEHRGYACPGYAPKHPTVGKVVPDGRLLSISGGAPSKLMAEVKKLAKAADCDKVVICFDAITCASPAERNPRPRHPRPRLPRPRHPRPL